MNACYAAAAQPPCTASVRFPTVRALPRAPPRDPRTRRQGGGRRLVRRLPPTREPAPTPQLDRPELPVAASPRPQPPALLRKTHAPGRGLATPLLGRSRTRPRSGR